MWRRLGSPRQAPPRALALGAVVLVLGLAFAPRLNLQAEMTQAADAKALGYFGVVAVGTALPFGEHCGAAVRRGGPEPRPENRTANTTTVSVRRVSVDGASPPWNDANAARIDGAFSGTTDEIIQWGACKWGVDEDLTHARVFVESRWSQVQLGDRTDDAAVCASLGHAAPCHQSYGVLQVKATVHEGTYPAAAQSTAWNVDYALAWQRACYEGTMDWLGEGYRAGDFWGCVGAWFSGGWWDAGARTYVDEVRAELAARRWETADW